MIDLNVQPTYFASLVGAMMASTDLERGRPLSNGLFSSREHYQSLTKIYRPWRQQHGHQLTSKAEKACLNTLGLLFPWMNLLAGIVPPTETRFIEVQRIFNELVRELERRMNDPNDTNAKWDGFILDFRLRLGNHSMELIPQLLNPFIEVMEEYHESFYLQHWHDQEQQWYHQCMERSWLNPQHQNRLRKGVVLLHHVICNLHRSRSLTIALNKFLGSLDETLPQAFGFGLKNAATIHAAPAFLMKPEALYHEIAHVFFHDQEPFPERKVIKQLWKKITPRITLHESPIPFWTPKELYLNELEEIVADFVACVITKHVFPNRIPTSPYAKQDEVLSLIFTKLVRLEKVLLAEGLNSVLEMMVARWEEEDVSIRHDDSI